MNATNKPLSFRLFIEWTAEFFLDPGIAEEFVRDEYLSGRGSALPEPECAGELLESLDKLSHLFDWILDEAAERAEPDVPFWDFKVFVDANLMDRTEVVVVFGDRVLLRQFWNPSHFWWSSEGEFELWANKALEAILDRLSTSASAAPEER